MTTVHVAIGNSDDRLTQADWAAFYQQTDLAIRHIVEDGSERRLYGAWVSPSTEPFQNACWAFERPDAERAQLLRDILTTIAGEFRQDSVAWTEGVPEFLSSRR